MVMSDLAPFVAAALRDKVVDDLLEENKRLKEKVEVLGEIRIVGRDTTRNAAVVYAKGKMAEGVLHDDTWTVSLEEVSEAPLNGIGQLEIRLGVDEEGRTQPLTPCIKETREEFQDPSNGKGEFYLTTAADKLVFLYFGVGPFTSFEQYQAIGGRSDCVCSTLVQLGNDQQGMRATFGSIQFFYDDVQDILDNLGVPPRQN